MAKPGEDASGLPADGTMEGGGQEPLGRPGHRHWRQSTITHPGLEDRGDVFFAAVEMTRMPMILSDPRQPDNPVVFANNAFLDLTGYETHEIIGRNCRFLQGAQTSRETVRELREAIAARDAISVELLNYRRDGSAFWNAVFIGPVYDPAGELLYFFASQLDVTRRRESEQAARQSQKMEAIGQLTAGLAHDFNNLLHVIGGSLERIVAKRDDPDRMERYLAAASAAAERGAKLTRQLLAFARRSRLEPKAVELSGLIGSIGELLDSTVGAKAELQLNLRRKLPSVQVDPNHLEMALLNVLINARDAMPNGGTVTVETRAVTIEAGVAGKEIEPGNYVQLAVRDEGSGMSPAVLARATEPFFTTKPAGQGTGLGLAMAHGFARQSGGTLEIETAEGAGTTISMLFPVLEDRARPAPKTSGTDRPGVTGAGLVLVVDDSEEIATLAGETLEEVGFDVVIAHNGEAALKAFDERGAGAFALVFSDVIMPGGMNGLVLAAAIRERDPAVPILMTTGYNDEMALDGPRPEAMDVIGKPYRRSELVDRVMSAIRSGSRSGPGRRTSDFGVAHA